MEQFLLDKVKNNNLDEIDKAMIAARMAKSVADLHEVVGKFCDDLKNLCITYKDEFEIADVGIVCGVTDATEEHLGCKIAFGSNKTIIKCLKEVSDELLKE